MAPYFVNPVDSNEVKQRHLLVSIENHIFGARSLIDFEFNSCQIMLKELKKQIKE